MNARMLWQAAGTSLVVTGTLAHAQTCSPTWLTGPGQGASGVDGKSTSTVTWDPDGPGPAPEQLIIGGMFDVIGLTHVNNIASWDGQSWSSMGGGMTGGKILEHVTALTVFQGLLVAGGHFPQAGGVTVNGAASWDGVEWKSLGGGISSPFFGEPDILTFAEMDGRLYAGGAFHSAGGKDANFIAVWDGVEWFPLGSGTNSVVQSIVEFQDELYVGGPFTSAGGAANTKFLAKWDGVEWKSISANGATDGAISDLLVSGGKLIVGGGFGNAGGVKTQGIASWDGSTWSTFAGGVNGPVFDLFMHNQALVATGNFSLAGGVPAASIARWDGAAWHALGLGTNSGAEGMASYNGDLVVTGGLTQAGGKPVDRLARWDGVNWHPVATSGSDFAPGAFTEFDGALVATATQGKLNSPPKGRVVRRVNSDWEPLGGVFNDVPWTLHIHEGQLVVSGWFDKVDAVSASCIAKWNGAAWQPLGAGLSVGSLFADIPSVVAMETYQGDLYAGGDFQKSGSQTTSLIARWDGVNWQPVGGGLSGGSSPKAGALAVYNNTLIAAGDFNKAGGQPASRIAAWNGAVWQPLGAGIGGNFNGKFYPSVESLVVMDGQLYAGGAFEIVGGLPILHVARWDGAAWHSVGPALDGPVLAMTQHDGKLFIGGNFKNAGGATPLNNLAQWDPVASTWLSLETGTNGVVQRMSSAQGELLVQGAFNTAGGKVSLRWARWGCDAPSCPADCDASGSLNIDDFVCFQTLFALGLPEADCDGNAQLDIDDFICFQTVFAVGC